MNQGFRQHQHQRQNHVIVILIVLLSASHVLALWTEARWARHQRRNRPIAVALLQVANARRPPTPRFLASVDTQTANGKKSHTLRTTTPQKPTKRPPRKHRASQTKELKPATGKAHASKPKDVTKTDTNEASAAPDNAAAPEQHNKQESSASKPELATTAGGIRRCGARGPGAAISTPEPKPRAGARLPLGLVAAVRSKPRIDRYLGQAQVLGRLGPRALATYRIALPADVIRFELDQPRAAALYLGRTDVRCATVVTLKGRPLRLRMRAVPIRLIDQARHVASAVVDLEIDDQARIRLIAREGDALPFTEARLANPGAVSAAIAGSAHLAGF